MELRCLNDLNLGLFAQSTKPINVKLWNYVAVLVDDEVLLEIPDPLPPHEKVCQVLITQSIVLLQSRDIISRPRLGQNLVT